MRDEAAIALLIVLIIASAGAGYYVGNSSRQTVTSTISAMPNQTTPLTRTNGEWVFSIRLSSPLALSYNLTNVSGSPQTVHEVNPLINPNIYSANGTLVWAWNPPQTNGITTIPYKAGNWSEPLDIPTSGLAAGQRYVLSVFPLIGADTPSALAVGDYSIGESLMINTTIAIA